MVGRAMSGEGRARMIICRADFCTMHHYVSARVKHSSWAILPMAAVPALPWGSLRFRILDLIAVTTPSRGGSWMSIQTLAQLPSPIHVAAALADIGHEGQQNRSLAV